MDKMTEIESKRPNKPKQFQQGELTKIRKMVNDIMAKKITYRQAALQYNVTKYQVEKWLFLFRSKIVAKETEDFDETLKMKIAKAIFTGEITAGEAAKKHNICLSTVNSWIRSMPGFQSFGSLKLELAKSAAISKDIMIRVAHEVQTRELTTSAAARMYKVSRHIVRTWVRDYGMFNLDGTIDHQKLNAMPDNEKEKELLKQVELLKRQLSDEKLKTLGLETMIEIAEHKFNIKIKKKPGSIQ